MYNILFITKRPLEQSLVQYYARQFYIYSTDTIDKAEGIIKHKEIDFLVISFNVIEHKRYKATIRRLLSNNDLSIFVAFNKRNPRHSKKLSRLGTGIVINRGSHQRTLEFFEENYSKARLNSFGTLANTGIELPEEETLNQLEEASYTPFQEPEAFDSSIEHNGSILELNSPEDKIIESYHTDERVLDPSENSSLATDYIENKYSEDSSKSIDEQNILNVNSNPFNDFIEKADSISKNITDELEQNIAIETEQIKQKYDAYSNKNNGFEDFFKRLNNDLSNSQDTPKNSSEKSSLGFVDNSFPVIPKENEHINKAQTPVEPQEPFIKEMINSNIEPHNIPVDIKSVLDKKQSLKSHIQHKEINNEDLFNIAIDKNILMEAIYNSLNKDELKNILEMAIKEQVSLKIGKILPDIAERLIKEELEKISNG